MKQTADLFEKSRSEIIANANRHHRLWENLCEQYLPLEDSIWRLSRAHQLGEPLQGWKLHVSATIFDACAVFEKIAPFLTQRDVRFKAPKSLDELFKINRGLNYGYHLVGKFITIYPSDEKQAVRLANELDELTREFVSVSIPFDEQFSKNSSVFYRYGSFVTIEMTDADGKKVLAIKNPAGKLITDDRFQAVPEWLENPFQNNGKAEETFADTPLGTTYRIFRAITQRGKGGTYQAFDFSTDVPRLCIVKEGRRHGEIGWDGQDGYDLAKNEFEALKTLGEIYDGVPKVFASFEINGNFYVAMEYVEGKSLYALMRFRQRRFPVRQIAEVAFEIAKIIEKIHQAGWVWGDCKPPNLIVTPEKTLRPIDFEGAHPAHQEVAFEWRTRIFSKSAENMDGKSADIYAIGAVIYFLLSGRIYDSENPQPIAKLRRNIPKEFTEIIEKLLSESALEISEVKNTFEKILHSF